MKIVQINELAQGYSGTENMRDQVEAGIRANGQGRTLFVINPDSISINVMVGVDKTNWLPATINNQNIIITTTEVLPVNNKGQWIQLQVADDADTTNIVAKIL